MTNGGAYYNEIEPYAADWLENLIRAGHIAPGDVDRRSIVDVRPSDLKGYRQLHFFAGLGGWSYALRLAGWPDDHAAWTGSCPCQPLSSAGQRKGHADERHLWPAFHALIAECRPATVFGEQVASPLGREWLAGVRADLEGAGYAVGAADLPACCVGAPHIRQRLFWVADGSGARRGDSEERGADRRRSRAGEEAEERRDGRLWELERESAVGVLADANAFARDEGCALGSGSDHRGNAVERAGLGGDGISRLLGLPASPRRQGLEDGRSDVRGPGGETAERAGGEPPGSMAGIGMGLADGDGREPGRSGSTPDGHGSAAITASAARRMGDTGSEGARRDAGAAAGAIRPGESEGHPDRQYGTDRAVAPGPIDRPRPPHGFWRDSDWLLCRDGKWRPVEPGTFPLASGLPARVARLRAAGNSIVAQVAAEFVRAVMDCAP